MTREPKNVCIEYGEDRDVVTTGPMTLTEAIKAIDAYKKHYWYAKIIPVDENNIELANYINENY